MWNFFKRIKYSIEKTINEGISWKYQVKKTTVDNYLSSDSNDGNSKGDEGYGAGFTLIFKF